MKKIIENEKQRYARKTGERAAVALINAGYSVKIRRTNYGIFLIATYKRRPTRGQYLRKCVYRL